MGPRKWVHLVGGSRATAAAAQPQPSKDTLPGVDQPPACQLSVGQRVLAKGLLSIKGRHLNSRSGRIDHIMEDGRFGVDFGEETVSLEGVNLAVAEEKTGLTDVCTSCGSKPRERGGNLAFGDAYLCKCFTRDVYGASNSDSDFEDPAYDADVCSICLNPEPVNRMGNVHGSFVCIPC